MSNATIEDLRQDVRSLQATIIVLCDQMGARLGREQMCNRYRISRNTLTARVKAGHVPRPGADGKWLLSEVVEWEARSKTLGNA